MNRPTDNPEWLPLDLVGGPASHVRISPFGAELRALTLGGADVLWSGADADWPHPAALIYPVFGRAPDADVPPHGPARLARFERLSRRASAPRLAWRNLTVQHHVTARSYQQTIRIRNDRTAPLSYSFGLHPGFYLPGFGSGGRAFLMAPEGTRFPETAERMEAMALTGRTAPLDASGGVLCLAQQRDFATGGRFLRNFAPRWLWLLNPATGQRIRLGFRGFRHMALWSRPGLDGLCIEPLTAGPGTGAAAGQAKLQPGRAAVFGFSVTLEAGGTPDAGATA
ncbi:aldose epimerase family protein [Oceanomicrobium pacificus]|uniref:Galactose mutarotase n=1 Tax=Oceanomicrobium pacificus TaxID=2692916 RepID=A0A6B0TY95_9RHOB|nr:hypothetical protein [Oceanomicrobium pacificus]MXU66024.1 hypothetical protein [Oceanomicrobium pacificus]